LFPLNFSSFHPFPSTFFFKNGAFFKLAVMGFQLMVCFFNLSLPFQVDVAGLGKDAFQPFNFLVGL
jgi:hypothetical protein